MPFAGQTPGRSARRSKLKSIRFRGISSDCHACSAGINQHVAMVSIDARLSAVVVGASIALITVLGSKPGSTPVLPEPAAPVAQTTEAPPPEPTVPAPPVGQLDEIAMDGSEVVVSGWAFDETRQDGARLELRVNGALKYRFEGGTDGFSTRLFVEPGQHEICVDAIAATSADKIELGCDTVMLRGNLWDDAMIVAYYGTGSTHRLGVAGEGTADEAAARVAAEAKRWSDETGVNAVPAFDYIATVAQPRPGEDGNYSLPTDRADAWEYLEAIRKVDGYLILDFQPGRSTFLRDVQRFEEFLAEPDVGVALDPEWRMQGSGVPGKVIGRVDAAEINEVSEYLAQIVRDNDLPQKIFMLHKFTNRMIINEADLVAHEELAGVMHIDGFGHPNTKVGVYGNLHPASPWRGGFKLFIDEDTRVMTPTEVMTLLSTPPVMITYQ